MQVRGHVGKGEFRVAVQGNLRGINEIIIFFADPAGVGDGFLNWRGYGGVNLEPISNICPVRVPLTDVSNIGVSVDNPHHMRVFPRLVKANMLPDQKPDANSGEVKAVQKGLDIVWQRVHLQILLQFVNSLG